MEIGGYIEFDRYSGKMLHEGAVALNYARNALLYLCKAKGIKKIAIPKFLCDSVGGVCRKNGIECRYYSIANEFTPKNLTIESDEWIYIVNYYGQLSNERIKELKKKYGRIIVDNVQAYFQNPVDGVDTIYTCRKFFGVPDGAFLYTDRLLDDELPQDESFEKIHYLLGRFERTASEFYSEYTSQEKSAENEPIKRMSKLTENLLRGIDYEYVKKQRTDNFGLLHSEFEGINRLKLTVPEGAFMYPLYIENGAEIRKRLQAEKIYIPTLWSDVFDICKESEPEYDMAKNILPLPVDQRYGFAEVNYVMSKIKKAL